VAAVGFRTVEGSLEAGARMWFRLPGRPPPPSGQRDAAEQSGDDEQRRREDDEVAARVVPASPAPVETTNTAT